MGPYIAIAIEGELNMREITREIAARVLEIVDAGLTHGVGKAEPGHMCVEAAVCFALGLPHGDEPPCVAASLRNFKIALNDRGWSSDLARASGLRRLAIVQLGTAGVLDEIEFVRRLGMMACTRTVPRALRIAASMNGLPKEHSQALERAAKACESAESLDAARAASDAASYAASAASDAARDAASAASYAASYAASAASDAARDAASYAASDAASDAASAASYAASDAARDAASDKELSAVAEDVVQILADMGVPGAAWLDLAPLPIAA